MGVLHYIQVFPYQTVWQHSDGDLPNGDVKYREYEKEPRFSANISFYLGNGTI